MAVLELYVRCEISLRRHATLLLVLLQSVRISLLLVVLVGNRRASRFLVQFVQQWFHNSKFVLDSIGIKVLRNFNIPLNCCFQLIPFHHSPWRWRALAQMIEDRHRLSLHRQLPTPQDVAPYSFPSRRVYHLVCSKVGKGTTVDPTWSN